MRNLYLPLLLMVFAKIAFANNSEEQKGIVKDLKVYPFIEEKQVKNLADFSVEKIPSSEIADGYYFRLVQFQKHLNQSDWQKLKDFGVKREGYIPEKAWLMAIPVNFKKENLGLFGVSKIVKYSSRNKINRELFLWNSRNLNPSVLVDIQVVAFKSVSFQTISKGLEKFGKIQKAGTSKASYLIRIKASQIASLANLAFVKVLELDPGVPVKDDTPGKSLHRSNAINVDYLGGNKYNGNGVAISLADDGNIGPHIDFKGRLRDFTNTNSGTHGDMCSGIAVGAGNLDSRYRGMADGAFLNLFDIGSYPQINDAVDNFNNYGSVITSTSYSQGCNSYTATTEDGDDKLVQNSMLNFVFSGGNNGSGNCDYGAGSGWGNITGGYKVGKNVIAVGNTNASGTLESSSSRGPAPDGRIKPDICANGANQMSTDEDYTYSPGGGTSAACPGIAGITAQLYQAWREIKNEANPDGGLIKAILLNTADDRGRKGPDFEFGWGMVNAYKALRTIEEDKIRTSTLNQGDSVVFPISIPAGTQHAKIMVYWTDPAGDPTSTVSLVNNLDSKLKSGNGQIFLPWVLDPTPSVPALTSPALKGIDDLNNMEQISVEFPAAGNYDLIISGKSVPVGPQKFFVVYQFESSAVKLMYPIGGEGMVPGEVEILRWDAFGTGSLFQLAYSVDSGSTWVNISTNQAGANRQFSWTVPNIVNTGRAIMRLVRGSDTSYTERTFTISRVPTNIRVLNACIDSVTLAWNAVSGVSRYEVSRLGQKFMDSVTTVSGLTAKIPYNLGQEEWFSVRAIMPNGQKGRRAVAFRKFPGLVNCSIPTDAGVSRLISPRPQTTYPCPSFTNHPVNVRIRNNGTSPISNFSVFYKLGNNAPVSQLFTNSIAPGDSALFTFTQGINLVASTNYRILTWTQAQGDLNFINDTLETTFRTTPSSTGSLLQNFQLSLFPPSGWDNQNPDNARTWVRSVSIPGPLGFNTNAALLDNFGYLTSGQKDILSSPLFDLATISNPVVIFDVAYASGTSRRDTLVVLASSDCGVTFQPLGYRKGGLQLATVGTRTNRFIPANSGEWRSDTISLAAMANQKVIVQFMNINRGGNSLYIDNIRSASVQVSNTELLASNSGLSIYPNPAGKSLFVEMQPGSAMRNWEIFGVDGRKLSQGTFEASGATSQIDLSFPAGLYWFKAVDGKGNQILRKFLKE
jgi:hypothetical protein